MNKQPKSPNLAARYFQKHLALNNQILQHIQPMHKSHYAHFSAPAADNA